MYFDDLINNLKKAIKVFRVDGAPALFRILHYKIITTYYWKFDHLFRIFTPTGDHRIDSCKLVIFTGSPFDDIGGGQRAAQLARAGLRTGLTVLYVYVFPRSGNDGRIISVSKIKLPNLHHKNIKQLNMVEYLKFINKNTSVVFEMPHPLFLDYLEMAKTRGIRTVFELTDDWSTSLGGDWFSDDILRQFTLGTNLVTGTSKLLINILMAIGRTDAVYLSNAANEYLFDRNQHFKRPVDLPDGPFALYIGSLDEKKLGWEYIKEASVKNQDINYCLIGNKTTDIPDHLPQNVRYLGEKKIEEIPPYLSLAEYCLLPLTSGNISDAISPTQAFEYIFMTKPVVSTEIPVVEGFPLVYTASNEIEFANLCHKVKDINIELEIHKIDAFISHNSWFERLQKIIELKGQQNVSAVILIHNNRDIIERCLQSLIDNCASYLADVVVVDNASEDGGGEFVLDNFPTVKLVRNPINGCASGRNLGVKSSRGKYLAFFDSDQWFTSGFCFAEALSILGTHAEIGAVGWAAGWFYLKNDSMEGPVVDYFPNRAKNAEIFRKGYRTDIPYLGTGGLFILRSVFEATGGFDTAYDPTSFEDTDLSFAIKKLGFDLAYRDLTGIRHAAHQSTKSHEKSPIYRELFSKNSKYLVNKWSNYRKYFFEKQKWTF